MDYYSIIKASNAESDDKLDVIVAFYRMKEELFKLQKQLVNLTWTDFREGGVNPFGYYKPEFPTMARVSSNDMPVIKPWDYRKYYSPLEILGHKMEVEIIILEFKYKKEFEELQQRMKRLITEF